MAVLAGRDHAGGEATAVEDVVEDELRAAAVVGRGDDEEGGEVVGLAVSESQLGVGAGVDGAGEIDRSPPLQGAVGAVFLGDGLPGLLVAAGRHDQLRSQLFIVQLQALAQAAAVAVAAEDDDGVGGGWLVGDGDQVWQKHDTECDQQRSQEQAGEGAEDEGAMVGHLEKDSIVRDM